MMYNLQYNLKTKGKSIALVLLIISMVGLVAVSNVADADGQVSAAVTTYARDGTVISDGTATSAAYKKVVTASIPSADHSGSNTWRWAKVSSSTCDNTINFTYSGNTATLTSENDNDKYICFRVHHSVGSHDYLEGGIQISGIDQTKPNKPTGLDLLASFDTGVSATDNITNLITALTIEGCAETSSTVAVYVNGTLEDGTVTADGSDTTITCTGTNVSSWKKDDVTLTARSSAHSITAKATDAVGNISSTSQSLSIKVDNTAPTVSYGSPKITGGQTSGGVTYLNEGDTIEVTMTFSDSQSGVRSMVQPVVQFYQANNATFGSAVTATGSNTKRTVKYTIDSGTVALDTLGYKITNTGTATTDLMDLAGNSLASQDKRSINDVVIDTTVPSITSDLDITNDSTSSTEWAVESDVLEVAVTFDAAIDEDETDIKYKIGTGREQTFTYTTGQLTSGRCQKDTSVSTGVAYKCQYTVRSGDKGLFQAKVASFKDLAGNAGVAGTYDTTGITIDTAIAAPTKITLKNTIKPRDNDLAPIFVVTVTDDNTGGTVTLYSDSSCSTAISIAEEVSDTRAPYTVEVSAGYEDGDDGLHTVYADYADAAGNDPVCSTVSATYTLDTTAPTVEEVGYYSDATLSTKITSGKVANAGNIYTKIKFDEEVKYRSGLTANARPVIYHDIDEDKTKYRIVGYTSSLSSGRCRPFSTTGNASDTYICRYIVRSNDIGDFKIIVDSATEDPLGHSMDEDYEHDETLALDSTAPGKPTDLDLDEDDDSGDDVEDNITKNTTGLTITGCAETDSTVALYANGVAITDATDTADGSSSDCTNSGTDSEFSIDISLTDEGTHQITARATDDSNNTSSASSVLRITIDTSGPTATITNAPTGTTKVGDLDVTVAGTNVTHYKRAVLAGESCTNATYGSETAVATKITDTVTLGSGKVVLCVIGRDKTGNWQANADATKATWTQDATAPGKPTKLDLDEDDDTGLLDTDNTTKNTTGLTITGCAEADSTVTLYEGNAPLTGTVTANGATGCTGTQKQFTKDISLTKGDQAYTITATATDASNNASEASDALTITIKSIAPTITAGTLDLAAADDSGTNDDDRTKTLEDLTLSGTLSGNPVAGDYVQLYDGNTLLTGATDNSFDGVNTRDWSADFTLPENTRDGARTINAKVHDIAGNAGTATSITLTIDTTGPTVSVTRQVTSPTTDLTPDITIRTSDPGTVSFGGECADTSETPAVVSVVAGTNVVTLPTLPHKNHTYTDCTVMVTDTTDNTSTGTKINNFIVDNTPPTIASAAFANVERTRVTVTMNEPVYAPSAPSPSDFQIQSGGTVFTDYVTRVSGFGTSVSTARQSFTLITRTPLTASGASVRYAKGTNHIFDRIGNTVESFDATDTNTAITDTKFIALTLATADDTGRNTSDGLTRLDGDDATITVAFKDGSTRFIDGEKVRVFMGTNTEIGLYTVSPFIGGNNVQADNQTSFDITIPRNRFRAGLNTLSATYTSKDIGAIEGGRGSVLSITYDRSAPSITVRNANTNAASEKKVSAIDGDHNTNSVTDWEYKVLTEAVQVCNDAAMSTGTTEYDEGEEISFTSTDNNGDRVCFSSEDAAGNVTYAVSSVLRGIDGDRPTVRSVVTTTNGSTIRVTLSEPVYATALPSLADFKVVSALDSSEHPIQGITGLGRNSGGAKDSFVITLPFTAPNLQMSLKYTPGANPIVDTTGNALAAFDGQTINKVKVVSLALETIDDTGTDTADRLTHFDGDMVSLTVTLSDGSFAVNDSVKIYVGNNSTPARSYTIGNLSGSLYKNKAGSSQFTAEVTKGSFTEGENAVYATYKPYGKNEERGESITITYDKTAPTIDITNPVIGKAKEKFVLAADRETTETVWEYKQMPGATVCEDTTMTDAESYTEKSKDLKFTKETDNDTKVCFSSEDKAGNITYQESERLSGIDVTAPIISSAGITSTKRNATKVTFAEPVYAGSAINPRDFAILAGNRHYTVTGITGLASNAANAKDEIILNHLGIKETDTVTLRYVKSGNGIIDEAGNLLENLTVSVANKPFVVLELETIDDTGINPSDGITHFDGDEASFAVSITSGSFAEGDQVYIYQRGKTSAIQAIEVPSAGTKFTATISKNVFTEGAITLYAGHIPAGTFEETDGTDYTFTYDKSAPKITVTNPRDTATTQKKQVSAQDDDTKATVWVYQVIEDETKCDAVALSSGTTEYNEKDPIDVKEEGANGKKVCFSATDVAGNTGYEASAKIEGVDTTSPTVTNALVENFDRTRTVVTFSEPVYVASGSLSLSDFSIAVSGTGYSQVISGIENLPTTKAAARTTLVFTHPSMSDQTGSTLTYTKGTNALVDSAGNEVASFEQPVANISFVTLSLADKDDTGKDKNDNYTRFDGSMVTLVVSLTNNAQFSNGDGVTIYSGNNRHILKRITISSYTAEDSVSADGLRTFRIDIPRSAFTENGITSLSAAYAPTKTIGVNKIGGVLRITADTEAPDITVSPLSNKPASTKLVRAVDGDDSSDDKMAVTDWVYKKIKSGEVCDEEVMKQGAEEYTEGDDITLGAEEDNGMKLCFSSTDLAGNVTYEASDEVAGIDTNTPTVSSVAVTGDDALTVTMSEGVYSKTGPSTDDFVVFVNDEAAVTESITGIQNSIGKVRDQFVVTISGAFGVSDTVALSYIQPTKNEAMIKDATEKALAGFEKIAAVLPPALTITLDPAYDTGVSTTDGLTSFGDGTDVGFEITLNKGVFKDGNKVRVYRNNERRALATVTVGIRPNEVNEARGEGSFTLMLPKSTFAEGAFTLRATYAAGAGAEGLPSAPLALTYDVTAPEISISKLSTAVEKKKTVKATDGDDTVETTWMQKQITGSQCDAEQMSTDAVEYKEGSTISFTKEEDNGTKVCFVATDPAGNMSYKKTANLKGIDTTPPVITVTNPDVEAVSRNKKIRATDGEPEGKSIMVYQQVDGAAECDEKTVTAPTDYIEDTDLTFKKASDNGTKVCFVSFDSVGNVQTAASAVLANINEEASTITITVNEWIDPSQKDDDSIERVQAKAVAGGDGNDTPTDWFYTQMPGDAVCDASAKTDDATPYIENTPIVLKKETDNGTKICFFSVDADGVVTAAASEIIAGIDTRAPAIVISDLTTDPAQKKVVNARDHDKGVTTWQYKQIAGDADCDEGQMSSNALPYEETKDITFAKESDNGTKVCFSVTDTADNVFHQASDVITGIDATVPAVSSATLINVTRAQTKVVIGDRVRSFGNFSAQNFKIAIDDVEYPVKKVSSFEQSMDASETSFVLTHASIVASASATLSYTGTEDGGITDAVGNALANFSGQTIFDKSFVALSLDADDDTGVKSDDGITHFGDNKTVTLVATISDGSAYANGDRVRLYKKGTARALKDVLISGGIVNAIDADGETAIEIDVKKSVFAADAQTVLYTVFTPNDGTNGAGQKGREFAVSYLATKPSVKVTTSHKSAALTTVQATDTHDEDETMWQYAQIASDAICNADALTGGSVYEENTIISLTDESVSGTKTCFGSSDLAGNTAYSSSATVTIDLTAPAITVEPLSNKTARSKVVRARDNDDGKTTWVYRVIKANADCDEDMITNNKTRSYKEGTGLRFTREVVNGHKVCFSSTDALGNTLYAASMVIQGIDATAPSIDITMTGTTSKTVRARDTDTAGSTTWKYRVIKSGATCAVESMGSKSRNYREGSGLVFSKPEANGYKVCFSSTDSAGNVSYEDSIAMEGIRSLTTSSSTFYGVPATSGDYRPNNASSSLTPASASLYPVTRTN